MGASAPFTVARADPRTPRTPARARPGDRRRRPRARSRRAASAPTPPATAALHRESAAAQHPRDLRAARRDRPQHPRQTASGIRATRAAATGRRRSRLQPRRRARSRACTRPRGRRRGRCTSGEHARPGGIKGSSQSTFNTCSSWSDCSRPAAAASNSGRFRGDPTTADHTRGGTGSAASPTRYSAPLDPITEPVISPCVTATLWTNPVRARIRPRSARGDRSSGTIAVANQRAHGPRPMRSSSPSRMTGRPSFSTVMLPPRRACPTAPRRTESHPDRARRANRRRGPRRPSPRVRASSRGARRSVPPALPCR